MSVFAEAHIDIRPYSAYEDPSLPVASWISQLGIVGDGSGGIARINFLIEREGQVRITELFNLEQIAVDTSSLARIFSLETNDMDNLSPARQVSPQIFAFTTTVTANGVSAMLPDQYTVLPIWFGAPEQTGSAQDKGLRVTFNNSDGLLYLVTLQGYMWSPRSILAPGGPRRPVGGLFRA